MTSPLSSATGSACPECQAPHPADALYCPQCGHWLRADALQQLIQQAQGAESQGLRSEALRLWREALALVPADSPERNVLWQRIQVLSAQVDAHGTSATAAPAPRWTKRLGPLAPLALLLWKLKAFLLLALTKGKLLLFGLGKFSTFFSMLLSFGAYWALYGWKFGLGLVLSIYIHEMGHVYALRQFGIHATAPMFIPLLGAVVRLKQYPANPREDARVGLAGPIWGMSAAIATFLLYWYTDQPVIGVIAHFAAWINLFNLIPIWQLDGGRGFRALSRGQRAVIAVLLAFLFGLTREGFLLVMLIAAGFRFFTRDEPEEGDPKTLMQFAGLLVVLSLLLAIPIAR